MTRYLKSGCAIAALASLAAFSFAGPAQARAGWQATGTYAVPTGQVSLFLHADCPDTFPVVQNGAFEFDAAVGQTDTVILSYNGPRFDETPHNYKEWGWHFYWPNGAKAGEVISEELFCVLRE